VDAPLDISLVADSVSLAVSAASSARRGDTYPCNYRYGYDYYFY